MKIKVGKPKDSLDLSFRLFRYFEFEDTEGRFFGTTLRSWRGFPIIQLWDVTTEADWKIVVYKEQPAASAKELAQLILDSAESEDHPCGLYLYIVNENAVLDEVGYKI